MGAGAFLQGIGLGFAIAAPVGPIGLLCIQRTLAAGRRHGFVSGLGAATADALYGAVAGFGLTLLSVVLIRQQTWLGLLGGLYLCYLGWRTMDKRPTEVAQTATKPGSLIAAYSSTLLLTLANPITILSFSAIMMGVGVGIGVGSRIGVVVFVVGVFLGSAAWWLLLSTGVSCLRGRIDRQVMHWINRAAGLVILAFGLFSILRIWL